MGLEKIESFLGSHIEGFFNRRFASDLEPVELADGAKKEIRQLASENKGEVPNVVIFSLSPDDYSRLCAQRVQSELYEEIEREIIRADAFMEGELALRLCPSTEVQKGIFDLKLEQGGGQKIYIGRRDTNEFILTDGNASRLHAWVAYERHRHVLYDARSTNGTFVNDKAIERVQLCHGDRVRIGSTLLKYEVI